MKGRRTCATIALMVVGCAIWGASNVSAAAWKPGTNLFIAEDDANDLLERYYDSAYCSGIPRFGKRGEFPYEEFVRFDCTTERDGDFCSDTRYKSVKAAKRNYFRLIIVRKGSCY